MNVETLLIGGPADGEWVEIDHTVDSFDYPLADGLMSFSIHSYAIHTIVGQSDQLRVGRHNSLSVDEAMRRIFENYRPTR